MTEKKSKKSKVLKFNKWMAVSAVLALVLVIFVSMNMSSNEDTKAPMDEVSNKVVNLLKLDDPQLNPTVLNVTEEANWYEVNLEIEGQTVPFYATKDGEYLLQVIGSFQEIEEYILFMAFMEQQQLQNDTNSTI